LRELSEERFTKKKKSFTEANFSAMFMRPCDYRWIITTRCDFVLIARNISILNILLFRGFAGAFNIYNVVTSFVRA